MRRAGVMALAVIASALSGAPSASADSVWLCSPMLAADPCRSDLAASAIRRSGAVAPARASRPIGRPAIDCFYVYPTVSSQPTPNANLHIDPEQSAVAVRQAARFAPRCRVFAPIYRQRTVVQLLLNIGAPELEPPSVHEAAYADVLEAWREYLARRSRGRGFVLIGHSQGSEMLIRLLREEIETRRKVRRRLVSALLIGGNVLVRKDGDTGGHFRHVRACRSRRQIGCVVAYSSFDAHPPEDTVFGRSEDPALEVLCTNPAALRGGRPWLRPFFVTERFPGLLGVLEDAPPAAPTPWAKLPGLYSARCMSDGGVNWLQVDAPPRAVDPRPRVSARLGPSAGLHLADVNLALGDLVAVVRRQARLYERRRGRGR